MRFKEDGVKKMTKTATTTTTIEMSEDQMKNLVRNALMVAGQEMGAEGDHWPVIKNTITDIMKDWERVDEQRATYEDLKSHLYGQLSEMEKILKTCTPDVQAEVKPRLTAMREIYDAFYEKVGVQEIFMSDEYFETHDKPQHIKRAEAIILTLEEDDV